MSAPIRKAVKLNLENKDMPLVQIDYRKDEKYWIGAKGTQVNFYTEVNFPGEDSCAKSQRALARIFLLALPRNKAQTGIDYYDNSYPSAILD